MAGVAGTRVDTDDERYAREATDRLRTDEEARGVLAVRILESRLGGQLTEESDPLKAVVAVAEWIKKNTGSAGHLAVGFAGDDARGDQRFETALFERVGRHFELSPERHKGILGRLDRVATESNILSKDANAGDDAIGANLDDFFKGQGTGSGTFSDAKGAPGSGAASGGDAVQSDTLYDRLSSVNPGGYSPEVMAFQSAMNQRRAPGAPKLVETGRLDYATLRQPYYGLKRDIENLTQTYQAQRAWAQERELGKPLRASDDYSDPAVQAEIDRLAGGKDPHPLFGARRGTLAQAEKAMGEFDAEADKAKRSSGINAARIRSLSGKRREAARLIAQAAQYERVEHLRSLEKFLVPPLVEMIRRSPMPTASVDAYLLRGRDLSLEIKAAGEAALATAVLLERKDDASLTAAEKGMAKTLADIRKYGGLATEYATTPEALNAAPAGWRGWLEGLVMDWFPSTSYARKFKKAKEARENAVARFKAVAARKTAPEAEAPATH